MPRCPGQDQRYWTPEDIFEVACPFCGTEIEFWKDEPARVCGNCCREVRNPRIDLGCAKWCPHAEECLGKTVETGVADPLSERIRAQLILQFGEDSPRVLLADCLRFRMESDSADIDPRIVTAAVMIAGAARAPRLTRLNAPELARVALTGGGLSPTARRRVEELLQSADKAPAQNPEAGDALTAVRRILADAGIS